MSDDKKKEGSKDGQDGALIKPKRASFLSELWSSFLAGIVVACASRHYGRHCLVVRHRPDGEARHVREENAA